MQKKNDQRKTTLRGTIKNEPAEVEAAKPRKVTAFAHCTRRLADHAKKHRLLRMGDRLVVPHPNVPGGIVLVDEARSKDFINSVLREDDVFSSSLILPSLQTWFETMDCVDFPRIDLNRIDSGFVGLRDCLIEKETMNVVTSDQFKFRFQRDPLCFHVFDCLYEDLTKVTPAWDKVLQSQFGQDDGTSSIRYWVEVLIGRLNFKVKKMDDWQVAPYFYGQAGTGKSKIIDAIIAMLGDRVDIIHANSDKKFGLTSGKDVIVCPDVSAKLGRVFDKTIFLSMISGDRVPINRKNLNASAEPWKEQLALAGNVNIFDLFHDIMGEVKRRFVILWFQNQVDEVDSTLEAKIQQELPAIWFRCLNRYHDVLKRPESVGNMWKVFPQQLRDWRDFLSGKRDPVKEFISSGTTTHQVLKIENETTDPKVLKEHVLQFCRENKLQIPKKEDYEAVDNLEFLKGKHDVCKLCEKKSPTHDSRTVCCNSGRIRLQRILNMKIVSKQANLREEAPIQLLERPINGPIVPPLLNHQPVPKVVHLAGTNVAPPQRRSERLNACENGKATKKPRNSQ